MKTAHSAGLIVGLLIVAVSSSVCRAQTPASPVTMADLQQDFDAQRYSDVVRKSLAALQVKGPNAAQYDKLKIYALKAESHLRLKQYIPAADAFTLAAKEAKDEKDIATYKSTALLIRRSVNGQYTSKQAPAALPGGGRAPKAPPIAIVEAEPRKAAFAALFDDELKVMTPKVAAATKQPSLPPLMTSINDVRDLRLLELAATGSDSQSAQLLASLETHAADLMGTALKTMSANVEKISKTASESTSAQQESPYGGQRFVTNKRGLTSTDSAALTEVIDTSKNIVAACDEFAKALPAGAGKADHPTSSISADAAKLAARAEEVLKTDYGTAIDDRGGNMLLPVQPTRIPAPTQGGTRSGTRNGY